MRLGALAAGLLACTSPGNHFVTLVRQPMGTAVRLRLVPGPGVRINARLKPTLETPEGHLIRFDAPDLTTDSAYYASPPEAEVDTPVRGAIRVSVCPRGERLCRVVELHSTE